MWFCTQLVNWFLQSRNAGFNILALSIWLLGCWKVMSASKSKHNPAFCCQCLRLQVFRQSENMFEDFQVVFPPNHFHFRHFIYIYIYVHLISLHTFLVYYSLHLIIFLWGHQTTLSPRQKMSWHTRPWSIQAVFHSGFKPWNDGFVKIELPPIHPSISWRSENTLPILGEINTVACPILSRFPMINLFQYPGQVSRMKATACLRSSSLLEANCARVCSARAWSKLNKLRVRRNLIAADDRMRTEEGQNISKKNDKRRWIRLDISI